MANNVTRWPVEDPPNLLLAVDPGASYPKSRVPYAGCALFRWGQLTWAGLVKCQTTVPPYARPNALVRAIADATRVARRSAVDVPGISPVRKPAKWEKTDVGEVLNVLAVEQPVIYVRGQARPQDVVALSKIYGAIVGGIDAEFYSGPTPQEWKGSVEGKSAVNEKSVVIANATERYLLVEAQRRGGGGLSDHVLDAFGIGLFVLGRMDKGGVI